MDGASRVQTGVDETGSENLFHISVCDSYKVPIKRFPWKYKITITASFDMFYAFYPANFAG